ncbi:chemotaxis protein CheC [Eubacteriales bacterium OttesenSCG-928-M02]|nr:chemotaxis protein CheC [Eubacteriales bacterium OttesenSCG-928-M02]
MFDLSKANADQLDFFQEVQNIGAGNAATALATMLGKPINLQVPKVQFCQFSQVTDILNGPESLCVGLLVSMTDDLNGFILLVLEEEDAKDLSLSITGAMGIPPEDAGEDILTDIQKSALMEVTNILSGSYLTAISTLTGLTIGVSVPSMVIDMAGAIMNVPAVTYGEFGDFMLLMETEFVDEEKSIAGHFFLVPDIASFDVLLKSMGME